MSAFKRYLVGFIRLSSSSSSSISSSSSSSTSTNSVILNTEATRTVSRLMCVNVRSVRYDHTIDGTGPHDRPAQGRSCPTSSISLQNHSTTSLTSASNKQQQSNRTDHVPPQAPRRPPFESFLFRESRSTDDPKHHQIRAA